MKQFFKFMLASMLGFLLMSVIMLFVLAGMISSMASYFERETATITDNTVLQIKFTTEIRDRSTKNPFSNVDYTSFKPVPSTGLNDILKSIEKASKDPRIKGVYLDVSIVETGMANLEEIRRALLELKKSGKFIVAYGEDLSQRAYYLATVADKIYLNPEGMMIFKGLNAEVAFFKGTLEKLDAEMQIIRHGKYKSAVEPFMLDQLSPENREQLSLLLKNMWKKMLGEISESRGISMERLNSIADRLMVRRPQDAVELGLIDGVKYYDEIVAELKTMVGVEQDKKLPMISLTRYFKVPSPVKEKIDRKNRIAVIYAIGEILTGQGSDDIIGSDRIAKAIRDARNDDRVKAIVLRVNSPGGSVLASEIILREAKLAAAEKPFIVSMGNVAASGGYYISTSAHKIFAEAYTITGSIGVLGMFPNLEKTMKNKLGVTFDYVKTNENSVFLTPFRPFTPEQKAIVQHYVEEVYKSFINHVAQGRNMPVEKVDEIGQGRVWSGTDALKIGLVDEIGGLQDAIAKAAEMAQLSTYSIKELPEQKDFMQELLDSLTRPQDFETKLLQHFTGEEYRLLQTWYYWRNATGIQARMPFDLSIF